MQICSSAERTCSEFVSTSEWTATVLMPISLQARMTRSAISPRLAMRIFLNTGGPLTVEYRSGRRRRVDQEERLSILDWFRALRQNLVDATIHLRFDFIHELHRFDDAQHLPLFHEIALIDVGVGIGRRRPVKRSNN